MKYTVAIPAFKPFYLKEAIESILAQTYADFELLIVDDASPHDIRSVVEQFSDERIRYYRNEKGFGGYNVVGNWNRCLELAEGEYIICMGDDDKLLPNCLADYTTLIERYPDLDVYHMRTEIIDGKSRVFDIQEARPERESLFSMIVHQWKGRLQFIGDFLFRSSTLREKGGFCFTPFAWSADKLITYIMAADKGIANTSVPGFQYRSNTHTISSDPTNIVEKMEALYMEKLWHDEFLKNAKEPEETVEKDYLIYLREHKDTHMLYRFHQLLRYDLRAFPSHRSYWMKQRERFGFTKGKITKLWISGFIHRIEVKFGLK